MVLGEYAIAQPLVWQSEEMGLFNLGFINYCEVFGEAYEGYKDLLKLPNWWVFLEGEIILKVAYDFPNS